MKLFCKLINTLISYLIRILLIPTNVQFGVYLKVINIIKFYHKHIKKAYSNNLFSRDKQRQKFTGLLLSNPSSSRII